MIIVVCGVSWPATAAVARLLASAAQASGRSAVVRETSDLETTGRHALLQPEEILLLTVRWMTAPLLEVLDRAAAAVVFVQTPASTLLDHWMGHKKGDLAAASREVFRDLSPVVELLRNRDVWRFTPEIAADRGKMLAFLKDFSAAVKGFPAPVADLAGQAISWPDIMRFAPVEQADPVTRDMLTAFDNATRTGVLGALFIPRPMLMTGGFVPLSPDPIDLTGSARPLFFGPMIPLPSGLWTATATLVCRGVKQRPNVAMDAISISANGPEVFGKCSFALIPSGRMKVSFSFVNPSPDKRLELRLILKQAVFDGTLELESLLITPSDEIEMQALPAGSAAEPS